MTDAIVRAAWAVPIDGPPLADAWVAVRSGRICGVGQGQVDRRVWSSRPHDQRPDGPLQEVDLGNVALMPGLVNAHSHLELSWMRGRVPPSPSMPGWVRKLMRTRAQGDDVSAIAPGIDEALAFGTAAIGDVSNTLASVDVLATRQLPAVVFHELIGFDPAVAADRLAAGRQRLRECVVPATVRLRLAPHAPYSTSADLIRGIAREPVEDCPPTTIHVAESKPEVEFVADGTGEWRELLAELGVSSVGWRPTGTSPARYLDTLGLWRPGAIAVHGVHLTAPDLELLAERDVTLVTCPRSNAWVGAGVPPVTRFAASGIRVAIGTDSLASAPDLNVFAEMHHLRQLAPDLSARTLLNWATLNGATALGLEQDLGTLAPGRLARMLAVAMPKGVSDVEERLLSGIGAADVRWVDLAFGATR